MNAFQDLLTLHIILFLVKFQNNPLKPSFSEFLIKQIERVEFNCLLSCRKRISPYINYRLMPIHELLKKKSQWQNFGMKMSLSDVSSDSHTWLSVEWTRVIFGCIIVELWTNIHNKIIECAFWNCAICLMDPSQLGILVEFIFYSSS